MSIDVAAFGCYPDLPGERDRLRSVAAELEAELAFREQFVTLWRRRLALGPDAGASVDAEAARLLALLDSGTAMS